MLADLFGNIDAGQQDCLPGGRLGESFHAEAGVQREERGALALKRRGGFDEWLSAKQGAQVWHLRADEWIGRGVIRAEADAVKEEEEDLHGLPVIITSKIGSKDSSSKAVRLGRGLFSFP
jgi:hypothetical protein